MTWYLAKDRISISIGLDGPTISIPDGTTTLIAEDLCHYIGRTHGVTPRCKLLFGLKQLKPNGESVWLAPNRRLTCETGSPPLKLQYLVRFRGDVHRLDAKTLDVLLDHVRSYSMRNDGESKGVESEVLGLTVLDMYREMKEKNLPFADTLNDYKKFTPECIRRKHPFNLLKKPLGDELRQLTDNPIPVHKAKLTYLSAAFKLYPGCFCEEYSAEVEEAGLKSQCLVRVNPDDEMFPGLSYGRKNKTERWKHACRIEDLVYVVLREVVAENGQVKFRADVARKTGWPINFQFPARDIAESFVSALHGYYRLMEKWFYNLCAEIPSPSLARLRRDKMHGPVGSEFSIAKLREKKDCERGSFVLRESGDEYDRICLDVCVEAGNVPRTFAIRRTNDTCQLLEANDGKVFSDVRELLKHYSEEPTVQFVCLECVPPSEYDKCDGLLLCAVQKKDDSQQANGAVMQSKDKSSGHQALPDAPLCIPKSKLMFASSEASVLQGRFTTVRRARWFHPASGKLVDVAVKSLKPEATAADMRDLLNLGGTVLTWDNVSLLKFYGVVLSDPFGLVLEWVPYGPFDAYLRANRDLKQVDLSEAATAVVKAMNDLHDKDIVHGKVRCRNILVVSRTERALRVKLADPGLPRFECRDYPWIAPECRHDPQQVLHSKPADVWAFGTTLWEIFSFGKHPFDEVLCAPEKFSVNMLRMPDGCFDVIHHTIRGCWNADPFARGVTQTLLRHLFQALYMAHNPPPIRRNRSSGDSAYGNASLETNCTILEKDLDELLPDSTANMRISAAPEGSASTLIVNMSSFDQIGALPPAYEETPVLTKKDVEVSSEELGKGQYGVVMKGTLAIRGGFGREEVAVKKLRHQGVKDGMWDKASAEFKDEISIMKRFRHKNIVEVKGIIEDPLQLVLEFVPLGSLVQYERNYKNELLEGQLLKFSLDIAEGMEFLAKEGIVHRDLAARNVLVASHDLVKISDFGLARALVPDSDYYLVLNFERKLPASWHALESLKKHRFSTRSDVWSYGVTLCEMYSGCLMDVSIVPVTENLVPDLISAIEAGKRVPCPSPPNARISAEFVRTVYNEICSKCWLIAARDRPTFPWLVGKFKEYLVRWRETGRI